MALAYPVVADTVDRCRVNSVRCHERRKRKWSGINLSIRKCVWVLKSTFT